MKGTQKGGATTLSKMTVSLKTPLQKNQTTLYANAENCLGCVTIKHIVLSVFMLSLAIQHIVIYVVIKPEFSKFSKKIKVWSLSSSRCKFS